MYAQQMGMMQAQKLAAYQQESNDGLIRRLGHAACSPDLRSALAHCAGLRLLVNEYGTFGVKVPADLAEDLESAKRLVHRKITEDREQRLLAARREVERLRSQEEKREAAQKLLAEIEAEIREGSPLPDVKV